ncbi:MAG TPA: type II toxin-antitoxin system VapC family toxin [Steroidobacteraceae bacterium]|jgi:predicted nucleic acid-binding protein|nr:type II toxin-antitoxin system VapC family toxin [Steroidobacteraceae bacterium]
MGVESAYIDTSVLGAYYCPEPLSPAAESALRDVEAPVISNLVQLEFSSLVARKRQLKELDARKAAQVLSAFNDHVDGGFYRRIPIGAEHFIRAQQLVETATALRTLDALHLAAALIEGIPILTADGQLAGAAKKLHARVIPVT